MPDTVECSSSITIIASCRVGNGDHTRLYLAPESALKRPIAPPFLLPQSVISDRLKIVPPGLQLSTAGEGRNYDFAIEKGGSQLSGTFKYQFGAQALHCDCCVMSCSSLPLSEKVERPRSIKVQSSL